MELLPEAEQALRRTRERAPGDCGPTRAFYPWHRRYGGLRSPDDSHGDQIAGSSTFVPSAHPAQLLNVRRNNGRSDEVVGVVFFTRIANSEPEPAKI